MKNYYYLAVSWINYYLGDIISRCLFKGSLGFFSYDLYRKLMEKSSDYQDKLKNTKLYNKTPWTDVKQKYE